MGRLGVTKEDVFKACEMLGKKGVQITVANVREELGSGSYTTLLPLIESYRASNKQAQEMAQNSNLYPAVPEELNEHGLKAVQEIWLKATVQANKRIEEHSQQFKTQLADLKKQVDEKIQELSQALIDITRLEKELSSTKAELSDTAKTVDQKDGEINLLKTQLKTKEADYKLALERAVSAEKNLEFSKKNK